MKQITALRLSGLDTPAIVRRLVEEGIRPPSRAKVWTPQILRKLLIATGVGDDRNHPDALQADEWWMPTLAEKLKIDGHKLRHWASKGWLRTRRTPIQRLWIVWADEVELERLAKLRNHSKIGVKYFPLDLITPKSATS